MEATAARQALIRDAMPKVAAMVTERRRRLGHAFVNECIKRGLAGEPGWFFAREGGLAIGTPWGDDPAVSNFAAAAITSTQVVLVMREPGAHDGP